MKNKLLNILLPVAVIALAGILLIGMQWMRKPAAVDEVVIVVHGEDYCRVPLSEPAEIVIEQEEGVRNVVTITGEAVYMSESTCKNQHCVQMGEVTRENWETRVNQEFIICLPNQVVVELKTAQ